MFTVRDNKIIYSTILFIFIFIGINFIKPSFLYNKDGSIREFGIGYKNKTIFPVWLLSITLGILCYLTVMFSISYKRMFKVI